MIDIHENRREIPTGKVLLAEYGTVPRSEMSKREIVKTRSVKAWNNAKLELVVKSSGWNIAGSMLRWDNGAYGCIWHASNGTTHGQWYKTFADANAHYNRIPD